MFVTGVQTCALPICIGIWGWSYGGYMTLMSMSEGTPVFKAGVAVAAPTDWRFYDTIYTERFMRTPKENAEGYKESSAFTRADKLHGNLLLVHGTADDNVHFQNCAEYTEHLVQLGKQFDMQVYTNRNHGIYGGNSVAPLLVSSRQGLGKSTFCRLLMPDVLKAYYTESYDLGSPASAEADRKSVV